LLFGRFRQIRELGRGGMGLVLLAHDEVLGVQMAIKIIPEQVVQDTEGVVDLKKEVLRGMALTHPGIVRVYSFERDATHAGIVMEFVEGETLADLKVRQPSHCFDCDTVRPWLEQLCAGLDYAHREARIAHRDIKPRNLILTQDGRLKVADFGIASSLSETLTRISVRLDACGTPPYMSPQQALGERPTTADDIYSLGATFYELLTGKPPFYRGNVLAQVLQETPPTMTERRIELGVTGTSAIPEVWETMIARCLAKESADRPESAAAVLEFFKGKALPAAAEKPPIVRVPNLARTAPEPVASALPASTFKQRESSRASSWAGLRQSALVLAAAACTAGGLHLLRHRQKDSAPPKAAAAPVPTAAPATSTNAGRANATSPKILREAQLGSGKGLDGARLQGPGSDPGAKK
jgi:serine/threonine protein kinase